jgi:hypothetical protein
MDLYGGGTSMDIGMHAKHDIHVKHDIHAKHDKNCKKQKKNDIVIGGGFPFIIVPNKDIFRQESFHINNLINVYNTIKNTDKKDNKNIIDTI